MSEAFYQDQVWRRKADGMLYLTKRIRMPWEAGHHRVRVIRQDNGHEHWISWRHLESKYERVGADG